ncbi:MAG: YrdB family protein [Anaerolineales bacterium]|nr:YrdB family protein [Anaerolineales bacterium]
MGNHPINLALRFILELVALFALGYWGWTQHAGLARLIWTIGLPLVAAILWGTFRVPDDPGKAPVPIPGFLRLLLELVILGIATWAFFASGLQTVGIIYGIIVLIHYLVSYDRIIWLLKQ